MIRSFNKALPLDLLPPRTGDNNVDMARLLDFVTRLYYPHVDDSFSTQLYISSAIITFLIIPSSIVVLHRLIHGRLWFLKIWPVAGEYYHGNPKFQKSYFLWRILIWTPLWLGGWWSGFGILSAFPDALRYERKTRTYNKTLDDFDAWRQAVDEPTFQERSGQGSKNGFQSTPDVHAAQTRSLCDDMQQSGDELKETEDGLQKSSEGRNDLLEIDERNDATSTSSSRVFPPMKMASVTLPSRPSQYRTMEQRRIHILGRVYRNIGIQYCGVCFAILCFFGSSMVLAAHCYDSARNNTIAINSVVAALTVTYPIIIFGFLVVSLFFWRSFDPALSIDVAENESPFTSTRSTLEKLTKRALRIGQLGQHQGAGEDTLNPHPSRHRGSSFGHIGSFEVPRSGGSETETKTRHLEFSKLTYDDSKAR
ncbi:uncharacterized protein UBRO_01467 [Ustilago bromivora]|uniref:Uncharacterized protein n=1 Tax=Ustilago bromivora TaxID=307758 RepID=A0A1K0FYZ6_9BASI|nr:uncharacterized protein UBRO_01467 [Ustilago bromivora]SYW81648.1 uncharacterized protein UBRO2_04350 [Ustilago bromivora]